MKFKHPKCGTVKIARRFAFFPFYSEQDEVTIWLEWMYARVIYNNLYRRWEFIQFATKEEYLAQQENMGV